MVVFDTRGKICYMYQTMIYSVVYDTYTLFRNKSSIFILRYTIVIMLYRASVDLSPLCLSGQQRNVCQIIVKVIWNAYVLFCFCFFPSNTHTLDAYLRWKTP